MVPKNVYTRVLHWFGNGRIKLQQRNVATTSSHFYPIIPMVIEQTVSMPNYYFFFTLQGGDILLWDVIIVNSENLVVLDPLRFSLTLRSIQ